MRYESKTWKTESNFLNLTVSDFLWLLAMNMLLFQSAIQNATGFTLIDELATAALVIAALLKASRGSLKLRGGLLAGVFICVATLVLIGLASNYASGVTDNLKPILADVFACIKFPIALISANLVFKDAALLRTVFEGETRALILVLFVLAVLNLFVPIADFGNDPRYGLRASFQFVFGHPEGVNFVVVGLLTVLLLDRKRNLVWILLGTIVMCLTLRSKAFVYVAVVWFLTATWGKKGKLKKYHVMLGVLAAIAIGYDQFVYYYNSEGFARSELTRVGFLIANEYFPLGSGFATYGSNITASTAYYSPLYYKYGLSTVDGLIPGSVSFLSDVFWPIVIGQFGWIGLVIYILMIALLFIFLYKGSSHSGQRLACLACLLFLLVSSTAESAFFHPCAIYLAICLGLALSSNKADGSEAVTADGIEIA